MTLRAVVREGHLVVDEATNTASPSSDATRCRSRSSPRAWRKTLAIVTSRNTRLIQRSPMLRRAMPSASRPTAKSPHATDMVRSRTGRCSRSIVSVAPVANQSRNSRYAR
jgi:hypothetical protein